MPSSAELINKVLGLIITAQPQDHGQGTITYTSKGLTTAVNDLVVSLGYGHVRARNSNTISSLTYILGLYMGRRDPIHGIETAGWKSALLPLLP